MIMPNLSIVSANTQTVEDWFDSVIKTKEVQSEPISFNDDPVALACASYRAWQENFAGRWADLGSVMPNEQDRQMAQDLRHYYRARLTWQALKTGAGTASTFRRKLAAIVSNTHQYTKEDIGLLHRLPYFYYEDQALDRVFAAAKDPADVSRLSYEVEETLTPLERVLRSRRAGDYIYFYWKSPEDHLHLLVVKQDNPLISIVEHLFKQPETRIRAWAYSKHARGYHQGRVFFQLANVEIV